MGGITPKGAFRIVEGEGTWCGVRQNRRANFCFLTSLTAYSSMHVLTYMFTDWLLILDGMSGQPDVLRSPAPICNGTHSTWLSANCSGVL